MSGRRDVTIEERIFTGIATAVPKMNRKQITDFIFLDL